MAVDRAALLQQMLTTDERKRASGVGLPASWSIMDSVNQSGPPNRPLNFYGGAALAGVTLIAVGIVGGVILKDISELAVVATTLPGIALLLVGIRGKGRDQV
jgi:hypothetical protein